MTTATIIRRSEGCCLHLEGHATGSETVCAAISAIVSTLAGYLRNAREHLRTEPVVDMEPGDCMVYASGDESVEAVFLAAEIGLRQLEMTAPELLKVTVAAEK